MGLLKKLKKMHKKTIAHKLVSKDPLLGKLMGGKKKKGGGSASVAESAPATAKTSLAPRPALKSAVAASQAAAAAKPKPMQTGGGAQKTPVTTKPMRVGGPGQMNPAARPMPKPGLRTGGPMKPMGAGVPSRPSSAGSSLARIAKGYKNR